MSDPTQTADALKPVRHFFCLMKVHEILNCWHYFIVFVAQSSSLRPFCCSKKCQGAGHPGCPANPVWGNTVPADNFFIFNESKSASQNFLDMKNSCVKAGHCWSAKRGNYGGPMCFEPMGPYNGDQLAKNLAANSVVGPRIGKDLPDTVTAGEGTFSFLRFLFVHFSSFSINLFILVTFFVQNSKTF